MYKQSINFKKFSDQLNVEHEDAFIYSHTQIPWLDVFNKIGYENLYKAYFKGVENLSFNLNNKIKLFNTLWATIEFLNKTNDEASDKAEKFVEKNAAFNELRNLSLGKAQQIIEDFRIRFNGQLGLYEPLGIFFGKREGIIKNYVDTPNRTLPHLTEKYFQNLLTLNRDNVDLVQRYERDIKSVELNSHLLECSLRYSNMSNHLESAQHYFNHLQKTYESYYKDLKRNYRYLYNVPIKHRLKNQVSYYYYFISKLYTLE